MPRILYVHHAESIGGATISLRYLVQDALGSGHECHVATPNPEIARIFEDLGAQTRLLPVPALNHNSALWYRATPSDAARLVKAALKSALSCLRLGRAIKEIGPDAVHLNSSVLVLQAVAARSLGIPVVWHVRENIARGYFGIRRSLLAAAMRLCAEKVVCIGERERELLGLSAPHAVIMRNYVRMSEFAGYGAADRQSASSPFIVLSLGGLSRIKGASTLLESARLAGLEYEFRIVGEADPERTRGGNAMRSRSPGNVRYYPPCLDVRPHLSECDVLVFWGTVPHFARPVYEAWAMGKPVIALSVCADASSIRGETAYIVDEDSPAALAAAVSEVRNGYAAQLRKAETGREVARRLFSEANYGIVEGIYRNLRRRRPAIREEKDKEGSAAVMPMRRNAT